MRSIHLRILSLIVPALTAMVSAQNEFMIYPERNGSATTYTSRVGGAVDQIEILKEVPRSMFVGVGDLGTQSAVTGAFAWMVDEDGTTAETYYYVLRKEATGGGPDGTPAGLISRQGPYTTPVFGAGRFTIVGTQSFSPPLTLANDKTFYFGVEFVRPTNGTWPTDGLGVWVAYYNLPTNRTVGDNPRPGATNLAWTIVNTVAQLSSNPLTCRMGLQVLSPVLNAGGIDPANTRQTPAGSPNYGAGGMFPVVATTGRNDGINMRVEDRGRIGGTAYILLSVGQSPIPLPILGPNAGNLWLDLSLVLPVGSSTIDASGVAIVPIAPPGGVPGTVLGATAHFQALVVGTTFAFSNAVGVSF